MKRIALILLAALATGTAATAQNKTQKTWHKVKHDTKVAANKTGHAAATAASKVVDKTYDGKTGPNGETVYINKKSQYYYLDAKGHRTYATEAQLKDR